MLGAYRRRTREADSAAPLVTRRFCGDRFFLICRRFPPDKYHHPQNKDKTIMPSHQFNARRLQELEELLDIEYEKSYEFERQISLAEPASRITLKLQFKRDVTPRLRALEEEYAEMLVAGAPASQIPEAEAEALVVELSEATGAVLEKVEEAPSNAPRELLRLLGEIQAKLSEPKETGSAKLKVSLPLNPMICSYEMEVETAGLMKNVWRKASDFFKGLIPISAAANPPAERRGIAPETEAIKTTQITQNNSGASIHTQINDFRIFDERH